MNSLGPCGWRWRDRRSDLFGERAQMLQQSFHILVRRELCSVLHRRAQLGQHPAHHGGGVEYDIQPLIRQLQRTVAATAEHGFGGVGQCGDLGQFQEARHTFDGVENAEQAIDGLCASVSLLDVHQNLVCAPQSFFTLTQELANETHCVLVTCDPLRRGRRRLSGRFRGHA